MSTATSVARSQVDTDKRTELDVELVDTLQRYWGYDTFRPGQEAVVRSIAARAAANRFVTNCRLCWTPRVPWWSFRR